MFLYAIHKLNSIGDFYILNWLFFSFSTDSMITIYFARPLYFLLYIYQILTILLDSLLAAVFALPRDLRTEKAAATCLKASVSGPPPAMSNSCLNIQN